MKGALLVAVMGVTGLSCFNPDLGTEPYACGPEDACPPGYKCVGATGLCTKVTPVDAGARDASTTFGRFKASWSITLDSAPSVCPLVDAKTFQLSARRDGDNSSSDFSYPCVLMTATTDPIPSGHYSVNIRLLNGDGRQLNSDVSKSVDLGTGTNDLGNFQFTFVTPD